MKKSRKDPKLYFLTPHTHTPICFKSYPDGPPLCGQREVPPVLLIRHDAVASLLTNGGAAFVPKLRCHWSKGLRQHHDVTLLYHPYPLSSSTKDSVCYRALCYYQWSRCWNVQAGTNHNQLPLCQSASGPSWWRPVYRAGVNRPAMSCPLAWQWMDAETNRMGSPQIQENRWLLYHDREIPWEPFPYFWSLTCKRQIYRCEALILPVILNDQSFGRVNGRRDALPQALIRRHCVSMRVVMYALPPQNCDFSQWGRDFQLCSECFRCEKPVNVQQVYTNSIPRISCGLSSGLTVWARRLRMLENKKYGTQNLHRWWVIWRILFHKNLLESMVFWWKYESPMIQNVIFRFNDT